MALPRASSIFVEPVTMGNFIIFFAAVALTFRRAMGVGGQVLALLAVLFLLVASDGRLATATCLMIWRYRCTAHDRRCRGWCSQAYRRRWGW